MAFRVTRSIVPNLFTLGNLFCGFLAIAHFSHAYAGNSDGITLGALYILAAALFDALDGIMARLTKSASEIGVELDSLCDIVSFGLAPAMMLYVLHYHNHGPGGFILAALPAMAGAYRLARFNVQLTSLEDKHYFVGLPIPAAALTLVSYGVFYLAAGRISSGLADIATNFVTIATALAMISRIRYDNAPRPSLRAIKQRPLFTACFIAAIGATVWSKGVLAFPCMAVYIVGGAVRHMVRLIRTRQLMRPSFDEFDV